MTNHKARKCRLCWHWKRDHNKISANSELDVCTVCINELFKRGVQEFVDRTGRNGDLPRWDHPFCATEQDAVFSELTK